MAINIENPNEFIMKKNLLWHHNLPLDDIGKAMDEARTEGYKQGQIDATNRIFKGLQSHAYILIKPPKGATRKENVALDLTKAEFEDFKKQFEVN